MSITIYVLPGRLGRKDFRTCIHSRKCRMGERFFRQTRQIFAGILGVCQENLTKYGGKRSAQTAYWVLWIQVLTKHIRHDGIKRHIANGESILKPIFLAAFHRSEFITIMSGFGTPLICAWKGDSNTDYFAVLNSGSNLRLTSPCVVVCFLLNLIL